MNSTDNGFDWHKSGVYAAHAPDGVPLYNTLNTTAHACRASLLGRLQQHWEPLRDQGYVIQEYVPAIPILTDVVKVGEDVATAAVSFWRYPAAGHVAPPGSTVHLLTRGGVSVRGTWNDLGDYIAWAPMLQRDKELEARLGL